MPIMMQRRYRADGWLGMLLGSKLYINFDGKYAFEHAYTLLLKELKERGRGHGTTGLFLPFFFGCSREMERESALPRAVVLCCDFYS